MRSGAKVLLLIWGAILACLILTDAVMSSASAAQPRFESKWAFLQLGRDGEYLQELVVRADKQDAQGELGSLSLVTRENDEPLSRHLSIVGIDWNLNSLRTQMDESVLSVSIQSQDGRLEVRKRLVEVVGEPRIKLDLEFVNLSSAPLVLGDEIGLQVGPGLGEYPEESFGIADALYSYVEPVLLTRSNELHRISLEEGKSERVIDVDGPGWVGLHSRYFAFLVRPADERPLGHVQFKLGSGSPRLPSRYLPMAVVSLELNTLAPGGKVERVFDLYVGPKTMDALVGAHHDLSALLFPGLWEWMRFLSFALLWVLKSIHLLVPSWGLTIIVLAVLVRMLIYPLARQTLKSQQAFMAVQTAIQSELAEIKKNYKGGEQSERILQLYERHGVSPLAGIKPLLLVLIQLPIFVALFHVLGQVFEFRNASFLWIESLAEPDRLFAIGIELPILGGYFNLLPVLMATSTFLMIGMSSGVGYDRKAKKRQTWMLLLMAVGFFVLFYPFPSGMVLYWTMANILHLLQYWIVGIVTKGGSISAGES